MQKMLKCDFLYFFDFFYRKVKKMSITVVYLSSLSVWVVA